MRLKSLRLQNYRIHKDSTLPIGEATFICLRGKNMSGKTSFAEALSMNLANTTVSLSGDGKGFTAKIAQGERNAVITTEIQGQHLIRNTLSLSVTASGRTPSIECLDAPDDKDVINRFKNYLVDRRPSLLIACNTDYFSRLEEKDQANLLAKLVLPAHHDFPKDKIDAVVEALGKGVIDFDINPFDVITKAYKALYDERKTVNVKVRDFVIPDALPIPKGVDSASLQTQVDEARAQRTKLQKERDEAVAKANEIEVKRATLQTKRENLLKKRDEDQKKLTIAEASILDEEKVRSLTQIAGKAEELKSLKSQDSVQHGVIITLGEQISKFKDMSEAGGDCPVCEQSIDPAKLAIVIADFEKEYAEADKKIQELDKQIEAIGDVQAAKDSLKKHNDAVKEKADIEKSLLETVATGKTARAELDALPAAVNATLNFNDPLANIEALITGILEKLGPIAAAEERAKDIKAKTDTLTKLQAKAASLDALTKYFDKDGVKADLIGQYIGSFESKINSVLDAFGYKTSLSMEPFAFDLTTARGYVGPVKELSKAEKQLFYPAFQCAVSIAAGIGMVVEDDMDTYLKETGLRSEMYGSIYKLVKDGLLEQAIMIEASVDRAVPKPQAPNSRYFFVTDGTVE